LKVVVHSLPIPDEGVPLDDVLAFARDATPAYRRRLLRALSRAELDSMSADAFRLNLEKSIESYSEHMRVSNMRQHGAVMTILLSVAGGAEELIHGRPRKALESLIEFRKVKADRLEAELMAPGREAAFIYEASRRFGS
jgi:hypothetical protein